MKSSPGSVAPTVFGVRLHQFPSEEGVRAACRGFLDDGGTHCIFTPNPEILLYARKHPDYAALLNQGDLVLPDGFGIVLVDFLRRGRSISRWAGIDVAGLILHLAAERDARVMFVGGRGAAGQRAAALWQTEIPALDVVTAADGVPFQEDGTAVVAEDEWRLDELIQETQPAVIFVALGHPKQEWWIAHRRGSIPSARILMGVGGALDIWAGRFSRAPGWLRSIGLEWLWRLGQEPARLSRVLRATLEFPLLALIDRRPARGPGPQAAQR
jgi:N-acetylglucosaminyldiphosphoundecaprenol N-acetyl-beta-D-mannosaminyltransferase